MKENAAHPRPLLRRATWSNLNGTWDFAFDPVRQWTQPAEVRFDRTIEVPYAPETPRSGIHDEGFHPVVWYRKTVVTAGLGSRTFLHFGAVDYRAEIWVNNHFLTRHEGGHTPFTVEVTGLARQSPELTVTVRAEDEPGALDQPRGKQDWRVQSHSIWYPRTTGIWQTVWLEDTPETYLRSLHWTPDLEHFSLTCEAEIDGLLGPDDFLQVQLFVRETLLVDDRFRLRGTSVIQSFHFYDGGLEDVRRELLWSPEHPQLIDAEVTLWRGNEVLDRVESYTALRSAGFDEIAFLLNGRAYPLRLVLDQGYWPAGGMSATDEEYRQDVLLTKRLGFNGARKHQKIEDPRYLYWCDVLGLLVWEEMPSAYQFSSRTVKAVTVEWTEAMARDRSHPCIVTWVPFNESWGLPDLPTKAQTRAFSQALFHLTKAFDPSRPVIGNDGWEQVETDLLTVHDYTDDAEVILERYGTTSSTLETLRSMRPGGRRLILGLLALSQPRPVLLTEFGGIAYAPGAEEEGWGYSRVRNEKSFLGLYSALLQAIHGCENLAGFCYTQLTDTYQEVNGVLTADRKFKCDPDLMAAATRGPRSAQEQDRDPSPNLFGYSRGWLNKQVVPDDARIDSTPPSISR